MGSVKHIGCKLEQQRLASKELLLYSGNEEENAPHTQGFALMLSKQAQNALIGWESHGSRIIKASLKTKKEGTSVNIIQCYVLTNDYNEDVKDQFYNRLQSIVEKCPTKDLIILIGDLDVKVAMDNTGYDDIMGRHRLVERNEDGERFANLCTSNELVISDTIFPHKHIHKTTWISPEHTKQNQIDHICINKKFRSTMEDVRTKRGADIASDHQDETETKEALHNGADNITKVQYGLSSGY
ncbi:unnamed protein product [Schistosoma mattheei]|uniref:Endo/exonuclease/phosphatase domain-containing protein n=1 Tax=Schistosoma mattheei TaxID=31246 RepID=A0A3P8FR11_9TREM|nr:unnamed protein product [Schistosoma mattheei]